MIDPTKAEFWLIGLSVVFNMGIGCWIGNRGKLQLQRTIDRQNDTIQRLIDREPVTYAEVGQKPAKQNKEIYAAWGAQMVDLDEEESQ